jgi:hypothetical protein
MATWRVPVVLRREGEGGTRGGVEWREGRERKFGVLF